MGRLPYRFDNCHKMWTAALPQAARLLFFMTLWNFERKKVVMDANPDTEAHSVCTLCHLQRTRDYKHWWVCPSLDEHIPAFVNEMRTSTFQQLLSWIDQDSDHRFIAAILYVYVRWIVYTRWLKASEVPYTPAFLAELQAFCKDTIHSSLFTVKYKDKTVALNESLDRKVQWKDSARAAKYNNNYPYCILYSCNIILP